jgi:predicted transcriptional regulator
MKKQGSHHADALPLLASDFPLDHETITAIREGLAQAERGEFVPDDVVAESNKRHGI